MAALGVWSRNEVTGISFEYSRVFLPSIHNGLVRRFPSQRLQVFGKFEGAGVGQHMSAQALQVAIVEGFDSGILDSAVHSLGLPIRAGVIRLGQLVDDAVFIADPTTRNGCSTVARILVLSFSSLPMSASTGPARLCFGNVRCN